MGNQPIQVEQVVHGYRDGHELLATSVELSADDRATLLVHSDLAVPPGTDDNSAYLTAYPLPNSRFYAVAKTWHAPEKPRPGCVWTQTLLLRNEDVARLAGLEDLLGCYIRPNDRNLQLYSNAASVVEGSGHLGSFRSDIAAATLTALYTSDDSPMPVLLSGDNTKELENLIFAVWKQQWPRLRRSFRFSTGAFSAGDEAFDLALSGGQIRSRTTNYLIVDAGADANSECPRWLEAAREDLQQPNQSFRGFLWKFGPDFANGRAVFRKLSELASVALAPRRDLHTYDLVSAVCHFFPGDSAARLKSIVLGQQGGDSTYEARLLESLILFPDISSIPAAVLNIYERAKQLTECDPNLAFKAVLTIDCDRNTNDGRGRDFLRGMGDSLLAGAQEVLGTAPIDVIARVVEVQPRIAEQISFWRRNPDELELAVRKLLAIQGHPSTEVVLALLDGKAFRFLGTLLSASGERGLKATLQWLDRSTEQKVVVPEEVSAAIRLNHKFLPQVLLNGGLQRAGALVAAANLYPTSSTAQWAIPIFSELAYEVHLASQEMQLEAHTFLLTIGFIGNGHQASTVISHVFSPVYCAAAEGRLQDRLWAMIDPHLPWFLLPWWDRCARLIKGISSRILNEGWPLALLCRALSSIEAFRRCTNELTYSHAGREYLCKVGRELEGTSIASQAQAIELRKCIYS